MTIYSENLGVNNYLYNVQDVSVLGISSPLNLPFFASRVHAGFPSPADDYMEQPLDLNEHLVKHPAATFFVRVAGDSMVNVGIFEDDILIVDRSITAGSNKIIVAILNGQFTVKRLSYANNKIFLVPENNSYIPIEITPEDSFEVWGVVTNVIHKL